MNIKAPVDPIRCLGPRVLSLNRACWNRNAAAVSLEDRPTFQLTGTVTPVTSTLDFSVSLVNGTPLDWVNIFLAVHSL